MLFFLAIVFCVVPLVASHPVFAQTATESGTATESANTTTDPTTATQSATSTESESATPETTAATQPAVPTTLPETGAHDVLILFFAGVIFLLAGVTVLQGVKQLFIDHE